MGRNSRRDLLRATAVGSVAAVAGCSNPFAGGGESTEAEIRALGEFTGWLAAPPETHSGGAYGFSYSDQARLRSHADAFQEFAGEGVGSIPGSRDADEELRFFVEGITRDADYDHPSPVQVKVGDFDREQLLNHLGENQFYDWDYQSDHQGTTLLVETDSGSGQGLTYGVGASAFLQSFHVFEEQEADVAKRFIDAQVGSGPHVWDQMETVARMLTHLDGGAIVELFYDEMLSLEADLSAVRGIADSYDISEDRITARNLFVLEDSGAVTDEFVEEVQTDLADQGYEDTSATVDGRIVVASGTAPPSAIDSIQRIA